MNSQAKKLNETTMTTVSS